MGTLDHEHLVPDREIAEPGYDRMANWHWVFGLTLTDLFQDTLLTYKSQRERRWTAGRLTNCLGYFVNYRKQLADDQGNLPGVSQMAGGWP